MTMTIPDIDNAAPHQIRLTFDQRQRVNVSCNCRAENLTVNKDPDPKWLKYPSFGLPASTREAKALYNDMTNHDQSQAPFTSEHLLEER